jgi:hypothetical protein
LQADPNRPFAGILEGVTGLYPPAPETQHVTALSLRRANGLLLKGTTDLVSRARPPSPDGVKIVKSRPEFPLSESHHEDEQIRFTSGAAGAILLPLSTRRYRRGRDCARVNNEIITRTEFAHSRNSSAKAQQQNPSGADNIDAEKQRGVLRDHRPASAAGQDLGITGDTELIKRLDNAQADEPDLHGRTGKGRRIGVFHTRIQAEHPQ